MNKTEDKKIRRSLVRQRLSEAKSGIGYDDFCFQELWRGKNPIYNLLLWHDLIGQDQQKINGEFSTWLDHIERKIRIINRCVNLCIFLLGAILTWIIVFSLRYM